VADEAGESGFPRHTNIIPVPVAFLEQGGGGPNPTMTSIRPVAFAPRARRQTLASHQAGGKVQTEAGAIPFASACEAERAQGSSPPAIRTAGHLAHAQVTHAPEQEMRSPFETERETVPQRCDDER